ncbi:hypothetical protein FRC16_003538 [Serendipita sp. 398]|nr:hypothetical protein FRC16_003538 [Serendipita sp. 398]
MERIVCTEAAMESSPVTPIDQCVSSAQILQLHTDKAVQVIVGNPKIDEEPSWPPYNPINEVEVASEGWDVEPTASNYEITLRKAPDEGESYLHLGIYDAETSKPSPNENGEEDLWWKAEGDKYWDNNSKQVKQGDEREWSEWDEEDDYYDDKDEEEEEDEDEVEVNEDGPNEAEKDHHNPSDS